MMLMQQNAQSMIFLFFFDQPMWNTATRDNSNFFCASLGTGTSLLLLPALTGGILIYASKSC